MPHLSPTTLTTAEQKAILAATRGNVRDNTIHKTADVVIVSDTMLRYPLVDFAALVQNFSSDPIPG